MGFFEKITSFAQSRIFTKSLFSIEAETLALFTTEMRKERSIICKYFNISSKT